MAQKSPAETAAAKDRRPLLSLDEIPHKRHTRCARPSGESPVIPAVGTPAFASPQQQYGRNAASELKAAQDSRRQHSKVSNTAQYMWLKAVAVNPSLLLTARAYPQSCITSSRSVLHRQYLSRSVHMPRLLSTKPSTLKTPSTSANEREFSTCKEVMLASPTKVGTPLTL